MQPAAALAQQVPRPDKSTHFQQRKRSAQAKRWTGSTGRHHSTWPFSSHPPRCSTQAVPDRMLSSLWTQGTGAWLVPTCR